MSTAACDAVLLAGIPADNASLFLKIGLAVGDPAAWLLLGGESLVIVRDIESDRAQELGLADHYASPADFMPVGGLDADRTIATAQAVAECLQQRGIKRVRTDRWLPFVFAWHIKQQGIDLQLDGDLGVLERRIKNPAQLSALARAQEVTEQAIEMACGLIARSDIGPEGILLHKGKPLTSESVRVAIAHWLLDRRFTMGHGAIVATAPHVADCHHAGTGPLKTGVPVVVDIFPRDEATRYWGDCTRTVVHGTPSDTVVAMHKAVVAAKEAATRCLQPGNTAAEVHQAAIDVLEEQGFRQSRGKVSEEPTIQHGTGHGIGLDTHEPILLDEGAGPLLAGEVFTIEPGLYGRRDGAVRVEDMLAVTENGPQNLNRLHEGLDWS